MLHSKPPSRYLGGGWRLKVGYFLATFWDWLKSVSAFANCYGGSLFFGVDNDGKAIGVTDPQRDCEFISEKIKACLDPIPKFRLVPHSATDSRSVIEVDVDGGNLTPYYLFLDGSRMAYIRVGNESIPADAHSLTELVLKGSNKSWDSLESNVRKDGKTFLLLAELYRKETGLPFEDKLLESFDLAAGDGNLTNAGLLFADECPVYQSRVICTRWNGIQKGDALNDAEFQGNLLRLLRNSQDFIKANTAQRWYKLPTYRLNFPEYSERAITEALVNHLIHRQYTVVGGELHIDIYDDRIEFVSPGGMVDGTLIQDLDINDVSSVRRNPIIADVFTRLNLMEKRGSGLLKILNLTEKLLSYTEDKKPSFRSNQSMFYTTLRNVNYGMSEEDFNRIIEERSETGKAAQSGMSPVKGEMYPVNEKTYPVNGNMYPEKEKTLGRTAQLIVDEMINDPTITRATLAAKAGVGIDAVKRQIARLRKKGIITREGSDKNGTWVVVVKK